jgi:DNA-binding beta-propeller fold protein YncE
VAVAPDGSVYVADTWNHRIQHLSADGQVLATFGSNGQSLDLTQFWGPRDVAVDGQGRVFVVDTGNKRVVVFNDEGQPLGSFGGGGLGPGQLDEPVGIAIGPQGRIFIADTWNRRIQVFDETSSNVFEPTAEWPVDAWFGQSLDNKPYLAVSDDGRVCVTDPEGYRVICFSTDGTFLTAWGDRGTGETQFGLPIGVAFQGSHLWVVDSGNSRIMEFSPP